MLRLSRRRNRAETVLPAAPRSEVPDAAGLGEIAVAALEATMQATGGVPAPTVHILLEHRAQPYFGYVVCRPFYAGADATTAISLMGALPSTLGATRLVCTWEHSDLCAAQGLPGVDFPTGLVVLDATRDHHVLRWMPFRQVVGPDKVPSSVVRWGVQVEHPDAVLPDPVAALLFGWRSGDDEDPVQVLAAMEVAGYEVHRVVGFGLPGLPD